jgi:hypothetical protein
MPALVQIGTPEPTSCGHAVCDGEVGGSVHKSVSTQAVPHGKRDGRGTCNTDCSVVSPGKWVVLYLVCVFYFLSLSGTLMVTDSTCNRLDCGVPNRQVSFKMVECLLFQTSTSVVLTLLITILNTPISELDSRDYKPRT